jgi:hypothetical protein
VAKRTRILTFGLAALVAILGGAIAAAVSGTAGLIVGLSLFGLGLGAIVLLVFLEIGLSEDHAREREEQSRREPPRRDPDIANLPWSQPPKQP